MKIGIISDLHSNIYVLEEILKKEKNIKKWLCLGDFVGLFPSVNATISRLREDNFEAILGDHERALLMGRKIPQSFTANEVIKKQRKCITKENRIYLQNLRERLMFKIENIRILMMHCLTRESKLKINFDEVGQKFGKYDVVLFGHTHYPLVFSDKNTLFINPGSAGFPVDKLKSPSYVVLDLSTMNPELKRIDFNRQALLEDIKSNGYNQKLADFIKNGFVWK